MVRNPRSARVWEKSRDLLLDSLVRPAHRDSGQSPASSWDVQIGSQRDSISVVERDFAVANFVALREDIVPFLAQIQFPFRGILGFNPNQSGILGKYLFHGILCLFTEQKDGMSEQAMRVPAPTCRPDARAASRLAASCRTMKDGKMFRICLPMRPESFLMDTQNAGTGFQEPARARMARKPRPL